MFTILQFFFFSGGEKKNLSLTLLFPHRLCRILSGGQDLASCENKNNLDWVINRNTHTHIYIYTYIYLYKWYKGQRGVGMVDFWPKSHFEKCFGVDLAANPSIVLPNDGGLDLLFAQPISGNLGTNHGEANNSACFFVWFQHKIQMVKKRKAI